MKHDTKGQIAGQIFIYIMAVIVIGAIALIGYSAIKNIVTKSCDAEKASFKMDIDALIEKYTSYGSVNKKTIKTPCDYDTICFVDSSKIGSTSGWGCTKNLIIQSSVNNNIQQNVFVISGTRTIPVEYNPLLTLNDTDKNSCLCINNRNKNFYITFRGQGSSTEVSEGYP